MNIEKRNFGILPDGKEVHLYTLSNDTGMEVDIINYGAIITAIRVPDRNGDPGDVVLGFDSLQEYLGEHPYFGATVGRFCNRIGKARFEIDGKIYRLTVNHGENHLHGGDKGFDRQVWTVSPRRTEEEVSLIMAYESPDGSEGYPGNLLVELEFSLADGNELLLRMRAKTDKPTHVNLCNHSYFNLNNCRGDIYGYELFIDADKYTELDEESIPTGRILDVEGSAYDFRHSKAIGKDIDLVAPGYDINYVLQEPAGQMKRVAAVYDPVSGRTLEALTTLPGIQLYTANYVDHIPGKGGLYYEKHGSLCLETQYFPDSPNHLNFPSTLLKPGETYDETTIFRFGTE